MRGQHPARRSASTGIRVFWRGLAASLLFLACGTLAYRAMGNAGGGRPSPTPVTWSGTIERGAGWHPMVKASLPPSAWGHTPDSLARRVATLYHMPLRDAKPVVQHSLHVAEAHHLDPVLLLSVVGVESGFDPRSSSSAGAVGLMQVLPSAHPLRVQAVQRQGRSLWEPWVNLRVGADILVEYIQMSNGDIGQALQRYNGSLGNPRRTYSKRVMRVYHQLSGGTLRYD